MFRPPVTSIVCPLTYENKGLHTANIEEAASCGVPGRPSGMSGYDGFSPRPEASSCFCGIPNATLSPSGVTMKEPASFDAVRRVMM